MDRCGNYMSTCCAPEGRLLVKVDVAETDGSEAVSIEKVNQGAAGALVDAEVNAFCNSRCELARLLCFTSNQGNRLRCRRACRTHLCEVACRLYLVGRLERISGSAPGDKGAVDGHDLVDGPPRPKPFAYVGRSEAGHGGFVAKERLACNRVQIILDEVALPLSVSRVIARRALLRALLLLTKHPTA
eukprot:6201280-Pleurochrysis_carterae.AAC.16